MSAVGVALSTTDGFERRDEGRVLSSFEKRRDLPGALVGALVVPSPQPCRLCTTSATAFELRSEALAMLVLADVVEEVATVGPSL